MEYKVKYTNWRGIPGYGLFLKGTICVDYGTVRLSGVGPQGVLLTLLLIAAAVGLLLILEDSFGFKLNRAVVVPISLLLHALSNRWEFLNSSVCVEKRLITDVARDGKRVSFYLANPSVIGKTVDVFVEATSKEEAAQLENELKA